MPIILSQLPSISAGDTEVVSIGYSSWLDSGELLTGTPTITELISSDLTLNNKAVNTSSLTILGTTCIAGQAVQCKVSGQLAGKTYHLRVTISTNATVPRTSVRDIRFKAI